MVSFHGISGLYNQNYVDGANNNQMLFSEARGRSSGAPFVYSLDSIKEFQTEASNYSAEFGQAAGGQVNAITKNGTNNLHGDLFYYLRYPYLNALDPYQQVDGVAQQWQSIPADAADPSATGVWRQRGRAHQKGQALLLPHFGRFPPRGPRTLL